jgi:amidohydrolase
MRGFVLVLGAAAVVSVAAGRPAQGDDLSNRVEELTRQAAPKVVQWRRDFHAHPELGNREERTARVVAEHLRAIGVDEIKTGVARHGVVAIIRGRLPGPTVALRADMDALPIREETGLPFASQNEGVMHACGHDAHTAILLGAAQVLVQLRDSTAGTVKLIFQPAEESSPAGEEGGASLMVKEGVLRNPDVSAIFALHVNSEIPAGKIGYRYGAIMAAVDHFRVTVKGKQSHAAMPWQGVDPIVTSAHIITAIQTIASRKVDARESVVVSVGMVRAGTAWNIIPGEATFEGTVRTHNPEVRRQVAKEFRRIVQQTAIAHGATAEVAYHDYGPAVRNDPELGRRMKPALVRAAGEANVVEVEPVMGGEDFSHYAEKIPGFYVFLGVRNEAIGAIHGVHTPHFVLDESALPVGVRTLSLLAIEYLNSETAKAGRPSRPAGR